MKYIIDKDVCSAKGYTLAELFLLLSFEQNYDISKTIQSLKDKNEYIKNCIIDDEKLILSKEIKEEIQSILLDSENTKEVISEDWYINLANKLKDIYPSGRKPGTPYSWKGNTAEIVKKLKTLRIKYNFNFTEEQATKATKQYVESFNGSYQYMKLLKYFLFKTVIDKDGNTEIQSEFMTSIENENQETLNEDWTIHVCN